MTAAQPRPESASTIVSRYFILGTAGHIDHGKTSLVKALTGTDTDRLPEERLRGMTIELGFAELTVKDTQFGVVDVPGHERFVRTMVAGATGIDLALLVVAADDSVMPQTLEHVEILHLLGVRHAVVAVTKIDAVDAELVPIVLDDVRALLADSPLAGAAMCPVSSITGAGIEELKQTIYEVSRSIERATAKPPFRMAVDRVFTVQGRGTVVTGSVLRGVVNAGDTLEVWPGGHPCRVRDLQTHGVQHSLLARGQRAAVNLSGVDREQLRRGAELAAPGYLEPSRMIDVRLRCLASYPRRLKSGGKVRLEVGATEIPVRVVLLEGDSLAPGDSAFVQLRGGEPITTVCGQRFILRDASAMRTIGGGVVLRPVARRKRGDGADEQRSLQRLEQGDALDRVEEVLKATGFAAPPDLHLCARAAVELDELPAIYGRLKSEGRWVQVAGTDVHATPDTLRAVNRRLVSRLERHHRAHPEEPGRPIDTVVGWLERLTMHRSLARPLLDEMIVAKTVKRLGKFICAPAFAPALSGADEKLLGAMIAGIRAGAFQPPSLDELTIASQADRKRLERLATLAVALGELVPIDGTIYLHAEAERELREKVAALIAQTRGATVAQIRETLNSSRKFVVPFVEYLDRIGFTRRVDDLRVLAKTE